MWQIEESKAGLSRGQFAAETGLLNLLLVMGLLQLILILPPFALWRKQFSGFGDQNVEDFSSLGQNCEINDSLSPGIEDVIFHRIYSMLLIVPVKLSRTISMTLSPPSDGLHAHSAFLMAPLYGTFLQYYLFGRRMRPFWPKRCTPEKKPFLWVAFADS